MNIMNRFFTLLLAAFCLTAVGQENLEYQAKLLVEEFDPTLVEGVFTYRLSVDLPSVEGAFLSAVSSDGLSTGKRSRSGLNLQGSVWNSQYNGGPSASGISSAFVAVFPELALDSFITIGLEGPASESTNGNAMDPSVVGFDLGLAQLNDFFVGSEISTSNFEPDDLSWFILSTNAGGGMEVEDEPVLVAQVSSTATGISGQIIIQWLVTDGSSTVVGEGEYVRFTFSGPGEHLGTSISVWEVDGYNDYFNQIPVEGCTNDYATNYQPFAEEDDGTCNLFGCTHEIACNYLPEAVVDDGSCDFCFCGLGTFWDDQSQSCLPVNSADINNDGCVQLNDLLDLLSAYGDCGAEESPWQCGDPLEYQGYDYETVQIGEQCWFAENLRAENYRDGTLIPSDLCGESWGQTTSGAFDVYGEVCPTESCDASSPEFDACGGDGLSWGFGYLYNWYAISDSRGLCPEGWRVPLEEDLQSLELLLGLSNEEVVSVGWRGDGEGNSLKATFSWKSNGNGSDAIGWQGIAAGVKGLNGEFFGAGDFLNLWSSSSASVHNGWGRYLDHGSPDIYRNNYSKVSGMSVRCIKDAE